VLFAGETIGWHTAIGGAAIIGGVALTTRRTRGQAESSESPPQSMSTQPKSLTDKSLQG
jgi:predicted MFS family arabinose efflux permease